MSAEEINTLISTIPPEETITLENLNKLAAGISSDDDQVVATTLNFIGDLTRQDGNRQFIGEQTEIVEKIVKLLWSESPSVIQFAARAVANFAYQHEKNRNHIVELQAPGKLVQILHSTTDANIQRNIAGSLANVTFIEDGLQKQLADQGAIELLVGLLGSSNEGVVIMSMRALSNIVDSSTRSVWRQSGGMAKLVELTLSEYEQDGLAAITTIAEGFDEELIAFASTDDWAAKIHQLAKESEDEDVRTAAWHFLSTLTDNDEIKEILFQKSLLDTLLKDAQEIKDPKPLAATLDIIGHLAVSDSCMNKIFESFSVFFEFLQHENVEVKLYTAMIIGNIARTDEYCAKLVSAGAISVLKGLLAEPRIQHLALGALRNIAIPPENKALVAEEPELTETILKCLEESTNAHVLYNSVLVFKILANGNEVFTTMLIEKGILSVVIKLFSKDLMEGQERIFYEAGRLLVIIANTNEVYLDLVANSGGLVGMKKLLETNFELLHTEAVGVIYSLVKKEKYRSMVVDAGIVQLLVPLLSNSMLDLQRKLLIILGNLCGEQQALQILAENDARKPLQTIANSQSEEMKVVANKVLSLLPVVTKDEQ